MVGLFYPVSASADAAMADLNLNVLRCAARENEARHIAGRDVIFKSEFVGDPFSERDEAFARLDALIGWGVPSSALAVIPLSERRRRRRPPASSLAPIDRRWPAPTTMPTVRFRISLSFWCCATPTNDAVGVRGKSKRGRRPRKIVDPLDLLRRAQSPLGPAVPQLALDIGLFEFRPADQPGITIADE